MSPNRPASARRTHPLLVVTALCLVSAGGFGVYLMAQVAGMNCRFLAPGGLEIHALAASADSCRQSWGGLGAAHPGSQVFYQGTLVCTYDAVGLCTPPAGASSSSASQISLPPASSSSSSLASAPPVSSSVSSVPPSSSSSPASSSSAPPPADLQVTQTGPEESTPGATVSYSVTVRNAGPASAQAAVVEIFPPFMSFSDGHVIASTFQAPLDSRCVTAVRGVLQILRCTLGTLTANQSTQVSYRVRIPTDSPVCNNNMYYGANATAQSPDPDMANNSAPSARTFMANCRYSNLYTFTKSKTELAPGETILLTMQLREYAPDARTSPGFFLSFPASLRYANETWAVQPPHPEANKNACVRNSAFPPNARNCIFHPMRQGQTATYAASFTLDQNAVCGQNIVITVLPLNTSPTNASAANGQFAVSIPVRCPSSGPSCTDSDGGVVPSVRGEFRYQTFSTADRCMSTEADPEHRRLRSVPSCSGQYCYMIEYFCPATGRPNAGSRTYYCPNGCSNGACS